jgi:alpha-glucosidase
MSYAGFTRPLWRWLADPGGRRELDFIGVPPIEPGLGGAVVARSIDLFRAAIPWRSWTHNLTLLGSHDTARWRSVAGTRERALVGAGVLLTFPGVPCVFQGDEVGVEGADRHSARRPMPWDEGRWDRSLLDGYRDLVRLRREHRALRDGGFRWAHVGTDVMVYLRETPDERILVQAARAPHEPVRLSAVDLGLTGSGEHLLGGADLTASGGIVSLPADGPAFLAWRL